MKRFLPILAILIILTGCGSDSPKIPQRPALQPTSLEMLVGETMQVTVVNATSVSAYLESDIATVRIEGNRIIVKALRQGNDVIDIMADGQHLSCPLHIIDYGGASDPEEEMAQQLADPTPRFCSPELELRYDNPGTVVETANDFSKISFTSIATGDRVKFTAKMPANAQHLANESYSMSVVTEGTIEEASLEVNGTPILLSYAEVMRSTPSELWILLRSSQNAHRMWLVVTDM